MNELKIKKVKPKVWNLEVIKGLDAWKEVVYSARMSGVPPQVKDMNCFGMMIENDYSSSLEHIIIKFDLKMSKGNAPEFLEHRMVSHSGYSTRYIEVSKGIDKKEEAYEVIIPEHLLDNEVKTESASLLSENIGESIRAYRNLVDKKVPREIARYVLPFAQAVGVYHVTINLRSLLNMLSLRLCVRSSPEFRCIASQLYLKLMEELPQMGGLVGCRGFMRGCCPESGVTGVRAGEQHKHYPVCPFKFPDTDIYIPTMKELRKGGKVKEFDKEKALKAMESLYRKWMTWE
ncbi:MAG: thymidylate synthase (FAD) [Candidatus Altiarchaeales archaeon ex4484_2]|nr:MAG: thymidylate synthase (FAD) [Candidatus Altiarchaeales archaeon ex4484_2]